MNSGKKIVVFVIALILVIGIIVGAVNFMFGIELGDHYGCGGDGFPYGTLQKPKM